MHIDWLREGDVTYHISIHNIMEQCIVSFELNQHVLCNSVLYSKSLISIYCGYTFKQVILQILGIHAHTKYQSR